MSDSPLTTHESMASCKQHRPKHGPITMKHHAFYAGVNEMLCSHEEWSKLAEPLYNVE